VAQSKMLPKIHLKDLVYDYSIQQKLMRLL
jgi:hypothetical protein